MCSIFSLVLSPGPCRLSLAHFGSLSICSGLSASAQLSSRNCAVAHFPICAARVPAPALEKPAETARIPLKKSWLQDLCGERAGADHDGGKGRKRGRETWFYRSRCSGSSPTCPQRALPSRNAAVVLLPGCDFPLMVTTHLCPPVSAQRDFHRCPVAIRNRQSIRQLQMQRVCLLRPLDLRIRAKHGDILDLARIGFAR